MPATATTRAAATVTAEGPVLRIDSVGVRFGRHEVLRDITLDLAAGETLVILGESGCGKTVLLKTMIGLVRPSTGEVFFEGRPLSRMRDRELAHLRTRYGFVFQGAALFDSYTIADNLAFPLREHTRITDAEVREIVTSLVDEVGLPRSVLARKPVQLSGGMRKRAGLARARPRVSSVVVTHDMHTARKVADRIVMLYPLARLKPGAPQIVFEGTPAELDACRDPRIRQFVEGRAGERLTELQEEQGLNGTDGDGKEEP